MHIALGNLNHAKYILKMINKFAVFIYSAFIKCLSKSFLEIICSSQQDYLYKAFRIEQYERELYINLNTGSTKTHIIHTLRHTTGQGQKDSQRIHRQNL